MSVFVTNTNDFDHYDRFAGIDYAFPKGEKVALDDEAAEHMFGLGRKDKTENLIRLGWATDEGVKKLSKFIFSRAVLTEVPANDAAQTQAA